MIDEEIMDTEGIDSEIIPEEVAEAEEPVSEALADSEAEEEPIEAREPDYAEIIESDLRELKAQFPELSDIEDITELDNPMRYAGLRDLGLTPREAYLATSTRVRHTDNRKHLSSAMPRGASAPRGGMSREELYRARDIFHGMSDSEIQALYRRVNA